MQNRLKKLLRALDIKQTSLSREIGMSESGLRGLLTGRVKSISGDALVELQQKFNVNPVWLVTGEGSMFLSDSKTSTVVEQPQYVQQLPVCRTTEQCLDSITAENIHQTRWFQELSRDRQFVVSAANTPNIPEKDFIRLAGYLQASKDKADDAEAERLYKKGEAG